VQDAGCRVLVVGEQPEQNVGDAAVVQRHGLSQRLL